MRQRAVDHAAVRWLVACALTMLLAWSARAEGNGRPTPAGTANPEASATPATSSGRAGKKPRRSDASESSLANVKLRKPKEIPFPLPPGESANTLKIPETNQTGQLLSQLMAARATRVDDEHVKMKEMNLDLYHPDGKEDFHIVMPASVFNLKTHIITSEDPVVVRTQDFELTGEKMEFNTVDRTGRLLGKVRMVVHNLKQVTAQPEPSPAQE